MKRWLGMLLPVVVLATLEAEEVYKQVDSAGNVTFSDKKVAGSAPIVVPEVQTFQAPSTSASTTSHSKDKGASLDDPSFEYAEVSITKPVNEGTVWSNQGIIEVVVATDPRIRKEDKLVVFLDGKAVAEVSGATRVQLEGVLRGSHQLSVQIVDQEQAVLASAGPVSVYLHHATTGSNRPHP